MISFEDYLHENKTEHNKNWSYTPDYPRKYRVLIIGGSGSGKTNILLNLIENNQTLIKYICILKIRMKEISIFN